MKPSGLSKGLPIESWCITCPSSPPNLYFPPFLLPLPSLCPPSLWIHSFILPSPPPYALRHTLTAVPSSYLPLTQSFMTLLLAKPFCLLLAHMTELELVQDCIKPDQQEENLDEEKECSEVGASNGHHTSLEHQNSSSSPPLKPGSPSDCRNSSHQLNSRTPNCQEGLEHCGGPELTSSALCRGEICCWRHGDYTLAGDPTDPGLGHFCLEACICFNPEGMFGGLLSQHT